MGLLAPASSLLMLVPSFSFPTPNTFDPTLFYILKSVFSLTPLSHCTSFSPAGLTSPFTVTLANSYLSIGLSLDVASSRRLALAS